MSCVRLVETKSNVIPINEPVVMAEGSRQLPFMRPRFASDNLARVLVGIGLLIGACGCQRSTPTAATLLSASTNPASRESEPRVVDLGRVGSGGQVSQWIDIANPFAHDVGIGEIRIGCECVSVTMDHTIIRAGQRDRARVTADMSHLPDFRGGLGVKVEVFDRNNAKVEEFRVDLYVAE